MASINSTQQPPSGTPEESLWDMDIVEAYPEEEDWSSYFEGILKDDYELPPLGAHQIGQAIGEKAEVKNNTSTDKNKETATLPATTYFTLFSRLPIELQGHVWKEAAATNAPLHHSPYTVPLPTPLILHVNSGSRTQALTCFQALHLHSATFPRALSYVHRANDVVHFGRPYPVLSTARRAVQGEEQSDGVGLNVSRQIFDFIYTVQPVQINPFTPLAISAGPVHPIVAYCILSEIARIQTAIPVANVKIYLAPYEASFSPRLTALAYERLQNSCC